MIQSFEVIMTAILAYMGYVALEGTAAPAVLGVLIFIEALFWCLDFLFIRGGIQEIDDMKRVARKLSGALSRA